MDESTLYDLLECSVCLERLTTSSKVLPCQHTFCRKCLEEIYGKHRELRCPECRVVVTCKVEDLPPNVLLMRILEGLRNQQHPPPQNTNINVSPPPANLGPPPPPLKTSPLVAATADGINKQSPNRPLYAKALYDYLSTESGNLSFKSGDTIVMKKRIDQNWCQGESNGRNGLFPLNYVQVITPILSHVTSQCRALYDFRMTSDEDADGCLTFNKGDVIGVIRRVDDNWAEGRLDDKVGIFPLAFVELNTYAKSLMKFSNISQSSLSKAAPPLPMTQLSAEVVADETAPLLANELLAVNRSPPPSGGAVINGPTFEGKSPPPLPSPMATAGGIASITASSSSITSTAPTSPSTPPAPPPIRAKAVDSKTATPEVRRHQPPPPNSTIVSKHATNNNSKPCANLTERSSVIFPCACTAMYPYKPQKSDELELKKGELYTVLERCQDGWFKGVSVRTLKSGVFPGNYVVMKRSVTNAPHHGNSSLLLSMTTTTKSTATNNNRTQTGGVLRLPSPPLLPPRSLSPGAARLTNVSNEKVKERKEKGVSLMKRLTSMKRSKSPPPPSTYSMDNPVFEDNLRMNSSQPVHVRNASNSNGTHPHQRAMKEGGASVSSTSASSNGKAGSATVTGLSPVNERFCCIAPYPPNTDSELELQVGDIIYVYRKREDGWYKGTLMRTGKTGLFPASFVEAI